MDTTTPIPLNLFTERLIKTLKTHPKRIVFPEGEDIRIIRVAARLVKEEVATPILLGNKKAIRELAESEGISLQYIRVITPSLSPDLPLFCRRYERIERLKNNEVFDAENVMSRPHYFASMMIQYGNADAMVTGNASPAPVILRAVGRMIKTVPNSKGIFGIMAAVVPAFEVFGNQGLIFMADMAMNPVPTVDELADIGVQTGLIARHVLGRPVRVAMLSSSTHGSHPGAPAERVKAATALAQARVDELGMVDELFIEGEVQADAALDTEVCKMRLQGAHHPSADVLIFPTLDSADITIKILDLFPDIRVYGKFLAGLSLPVVLASRMSSEERLFGSALVAGFEAVKYHQAHPEGYDEDLFS